jgi:hypothetical protein
MIVKAKAPFVLNIVSRTDIQRPKEESQLIAYRQQYSNNQG